MPHVAPATYVDCHTWVQQHMGVDSASTRCTLPIPRSATWSSHRNRKPLCALCGALVVLEEVAPRAAADAVEQLRFA